MEESKKLKLLDILKERSSRPDRSVDKGLINPETGSSLTVNGKGNVTVASSRNVQYKMNYASGSIRETSMHKKTITNRDEIKADEIMVNGHKLNPQFYELTDMKELYYDPTYAIGNLTVESTVLVKAWEPTLERWVLIRRPMRAPLFFNKVAVPRSPLDLFLNDDIGTDLKKAAEDKNKKEDDNNKEGDE